MVVRVLIYRGLIVSNGDNWLVVVRVLIYRGWRDDFSSYNGLMVSNGDNWFVVVRVLIYRGGEMVLVT